MSRPAYASLSEQSANLAARNGFAAQRHFGIDLHFKSHLSSKFREQVHVARRLVAETEVEPFVHFARMQLLLKNPLRKLPGSHQREIAPEGQQQHRVNARAFKPAQFFGSRREQL